MLPRSWLAPNSNKPSFTQEPAKQSTLPARSTDDTAALPTTARPPIERAVTAALATPHDAVLAELQGRTPRTGTSHVSADAALGGDAPGTGQTQQTGTSLSALATPEPVWDPSTGNLAYIIPPRLVDGDAGGGSPRSFEQSKDELWARLGRIRELQSEIAGMHVQMEGIGAGEGRIMKRAHVRTPTDNMLSEEWPEPGQEEEDKKKERDAEFSKLAQAFQGRHAAIDDIMTKLDELSKALTAFHALPTPVMEFVTSRNNTKDSVGTLFNSPSPTFTADVGSPQSPVSMQIPPSQLHTALNKIHIPRTESPDHASPTR